MIEIKNLTKSYGSQTILDHVDFRFPDSGLVCLLGASGCGKSTLLNLIAGFDSDYSGEITVCGTSISNMSAEKLCVYRGNNIGFIFQDYHLMSGCTVLENIMLACECSNSNNDEGKNTARELLANMGIGDKGNEKIENLSGGQKQRAAIARALMGSPKLLLADEPTGALDRKTAIEIMKILKELSKECLVVVITHDIKICEFADDTISIENGTIVGGEIPVNYDSQKKLKMNAPRQNFAFKRGLKNFKVHLHRYIAVAFAISVGILSLLLSLSSGNAMEQSIAEFKEKNVAYNNGYIKYGDNKDIYDSLKSDARIENVYYQYKILNISLKFGEKTLIIEEKHPMAKVAESMSYGRMPQAGKNEIALSPSLAKKFEPDISSLVGKEVSLQYQGREYNLSISGIFNAGYDDFYVSSDIEQSFYLSLPKLSDNDIYSISYDVKNFEDIVLVSEMLKEKGINSTSAFKEAAALQNTFENLSRLFLTVSMLILGIGLFISVILLIKLQNSRYREIGLYSALGCQRRTVRSIIVTENILLSAMAAVFNAILIGTACIVSIFLNLSVSVSVIQLLLSILGTGAAVILISKIASYKLVRTEPATALRK